MAETLYFTGQVNDALFFTGDGSSSQILATGTVAAAGPQGAQGPTGATGPAGANGTNGTNGTNGVGVPTGGTINQVLAKASATNYDTAWVNAAVGSGDVVGPSSATDNSIARFDSTTGKLIQNTPNAYIDDTGNLTLQSDATGGEDTTDSTRRLELNSYQRAQAPREFGEVARIYADAARSKQMIAWYKRFCAGTATFNAGTDTWSATNNYLENGDMVVLSTTGTLPTGYSAGTTTPKGVTTGTVYYVINSNPASSFQLSATRGGTVVDGTTTGTGTHTFTGVPTTTAWIGYHYLANDVSDPLQTHNHISIETPDSTGLLQTRLEVVADHLDQTSVGIVNANFVTTGGSNGVAAGSGSAKQFVVFTTGTGRAKFARWVWEGTAETESGSNAGTNMKLSRFDDAGNFIDNIWYIRRDTGYFAMGHNPGTPTAWIDISTNNEAPGVRILNAATGSSTQPSLYLLAGLATNRAIDARLNTDTIGRFLMDFNGGMAWGPGGAVSRDTTLNRTNPGELTTGGKFISNSLKVGSSSIAGQTLTAIDAAGNVGFTTLPTENFLLNPSFEIDYTAWTNYGSYGTISRDNTTAVYGAYSSKHVNSTTQDGGMISNQFTLQPGTYSFSVWAKLSSGVTNASMVCRLTGPGATQVQINQTYPGNTDWHLYGGTFTVSTPATYEVLLGLGSYGGTSNGTVQYDMARVQQIMFNAPTGGGSGITRSINTVTTTQSLANVANTDYVYHASGTITLTLPAATSTNSYKIMNYGTGTITIARSGSDTINGSTSATLSIQNMSYEFISDGISAWGIF